MIPETLGERRYPTDRSMQRQLHQSQHGSGWTNVHYHSKLSIPAVTFPTHAANEAVIFDGFLIEVRSILAATITVDHQTLRRLALPDRHHQCIIGQLSWHSLRHRPAHNSPGVEVNQDSKVEPALISLE